MLASDPEHNGYGLALLVCSDNQLGCPFSYQVSGRLGMVAVSRVSVSLSF